MVLDVVGEKVLALDSILATSRIADVTSVRKDLKISWKIVTPNVPQQVINFLQILSSFLLLILP